MPAWAIQLIIAALPSLLAAITALIQSANGKATPALEAKIDHLQKAHGHIIAALSQPE